MLKVHEVPLSADPQRFVVQLGATAYQLRVLWNAPARAWMLDVSTEAGSPILAGLPIVTGRDLLEPYGYLGFTGSLIAQTDHDADAVPSFDNLGTRGRLYFVAEVA